MDVVVTVLNEAGNIENLINSLLSQTHPCGIIIVDGGSTDGTPDIIGKFRDRNVTLIRKKCGRGEGRNIGVSMSRSPFVLFTDGDARPDSGWVECMLKNLMENDLVCGFTRNTGNMKYGSLDRVKIFYRGFEVTLPSMNMGIRRDVFMNVGGFDPDFVTAEDIDLNIRILREGYRAKESRDCVVTHNARADLRSFVRQGFWNGYGREQLKSKNRQIWNELKRDYVSQGDISITWLIRASAGIMGYGESMIRRIIMGKRS